MSVAVRVDTRPCQELGQLWGLGGSTVMASSPAPRATLWLPSAHRATYYRINEARQNSPEQHGLPQYPNTQPSSYFLFRKEKDTTQCLAFILKRVLRAPDH